MDKDYYSSIASGYDELYGDEQREKFAVISRHVKLKPVVLDIGCGTGAVDFGVKTIGIDPSMGLLRKNKGLKVCGKAEALPFKDCSFGSVVSLTALHHADIDEALAEIKRVAKPDAVIVLTILKKSKESSEMASKLKSELGLKEIYHEKDIILIKH